MFSLNKVCPSLSKIYCPKRDFSQLLSECIFGLNHVLLITYLVGTPIECEIFVNFQAIWGMKKNCYITLNKHSSCAVLTAKWN